MKLTKLAMFAAVTVFATSAFAQSTGSQLQKDVQKFRADLKADVAGSSVTTQEWQNLDAAIKAILATAHKPSQSSVDHLYTVITAAFADGVITSAERSQIALAFAAVAASAGVTTSEAQALRAALVAIYTSSNITKADLQVLLNDVRAIIKDLPDPRP